MDPTMTDSESEYDGDLANLLGYVDFSELLQVEADTECPSTIQVSNEFAKCLIWFPTKSTLVAADTPSVCQSLANYTNGWTDKDWEEKEERELFTMPISQSQDNPIVHRGGVLTQFKWMSLQTLYNELVCFWGATKLSVYHITDLFDQSEVALKHPCFEVDAPPGLEFTHTLQWTMLDEHTPTQSVRTVLLLLLKESNGPNPYQTRLFAFSVPHSDPCDQQSLSMNEVGIGSLKNSARQWDGIWDQCSLAICNELGLLACLSFQKWLTVTVIDLSLQRDEIGDWIVVGNVVMTIPFGLAVRQFCGSEDSRPPIESFIGLHLSWLDSLELVTVYTLKDSLRPSVAVMSAAKFLSVENGLTKIVIDQPTVATCMEELFMNCEDVSLAALCDKAEDLLPLVSTSGWTDPTPLFRLSHMEKADFFILTYKLSSEPIFMRIDAENDQDLGLVHFDESLSIPGALSNSSIVGCAIDLCNQVPLFNLDIETMEGAPLSMALLSGTNGTVLFSTIHDAEFQKYKVRRYSQLPPKPKVGSVVNPTVQVSQPSEPVIDNAQPQVPQYDGDLPPQAFDEDVPSNKTAYQFTNACKLIAHEMQALRNIRFAAQKDTKSVVTELSTKIPPITQSIQKLGERIKQVENQFVEQSGDRSKCFENISGLVQSVSKMHSIAEETLSEVLFEESDAYLSEQKVRPLSDKLCRERNKLQGLYAETHRNYQQMRLKMESLLENIDEGKTQERKSGDSELSSVPHTPVITRSSKTLSQSWEDQWNDIQSLRTRLDQCQTVLNERCFTAKETVNDIRPKPNILIGGLIDPGVPPTEESELMAEFSRLSVGAYTFPSMMDDSTLLFSTEDDCFGVPSKEERTLSLEEWMADLERQAELNVERTRRVQTRKDNANSLRGIHGKRERRKRTKFQLRATAKDRRNDSLLPDHSPFKEIQKREQPSQHDLRDSTLLPFESDPLADVFDGFTRSLSDALPDIGASPDDLIGRSARKVCASKSRALLNDSTLKTQSRVRKMFSDSQCDGSDATLDEQYKQESMTLEPRKLSLSFGSPMKKSDLTRIPSWKTRHAHTPGSISKTQSRIAIGQKSQVSGTPSTKPSLLRSESKLRTLRRSTEAYLSGYLASSPTAKKSLKLSNYVPIVSSKINEDDSDHFTMVGTLKKQWRTLIPNVDFQPPPKPVTPPVQAREPTPVLMDQPPPLVPQKTVPFDLAEPSQPPIEEQAPAAEPVPPAEPVSDLAKKLSLNDLHSPPPPQKKVDKPVPPEPEQKSVPQIESKPEKKEESQSIKPEPQSDLSIGFSGMDFGSSAVSSGGGWMSEQRTEEKGPWKDVYQRRLRSLYEAKAADKVGNIPRLMEKYGGSVDQIHQVYVKACLKYEVTPQAKYESHEPEKLDWGAQSSLGWGNQAKKQPTNSVFSDSSWSNSQGNSDQGWGSVTQSTQDWTGPAASSGPSWAQNPAVAASSAKSSSDDGFASFSGGWGSF